jgi:hypothetical protein
MTIYLINIYGDKKAEAQFKNIYNRTRVDRLYPTTERITSGQGTLSSYLTDCGKGWIRNLAKESPHAG